MRDDLLLIREMISRGWCQNALAVDAKGKPTTHVGHHETVMGKGGLPVKNDKGEIETVYVPAKKWSLVGAIMLVAGVGESTYPNEKAGALFRLFSPLVRRREFSFGVREFTYLGAFNDHSETKIEDVDGKKVKKREETTVDDVLALIDEAIAGVA